MLYRYIAVAAVALAPALVSAQGLSPEAAVQEALAHLDRNQIRYGVTSADLADLVVTNAYTSKGISHVYFRQSLNGIATAGTEVGVHIDRNGHVFHTTGQLTPGLSRLVTATAPAISPIDAVNAVAREAGLTPTEPFTVLEMKSLQHVVLSLGGIAQGTVDAKLAYIMDEQRMPRLAWEVGLYQADSQHAWHSYIDAVTGAVIAMYDHVDSDYWGPTPEQIASAQQNLGPWLFADTTPVAPTAMIGAYRVYGFPVESPNHAVILPPADGRTLVANPDVAGGIASPFGWHDDNGAAGPEYTVTRGNNVHAYTDVDNNDAPDAGSSPDGGAGLTFDFPLDLTLAPSAYRPGAVANLFYVNNMQHDILYQYGFDEVSGNFQTNNYGRGGLGTDYVRAEAQDGSGVNNANFCTPPDGTGGSPCGIPRMQMYIWTAPTPDRDGDIDNGIILHEYGHGVSNRLTGGPATASCLTNAERPSEGWSDYFSVMLTWPPGQTRTTNRGVGTYALNQPVTGVGIRPAPYNTDFAVNNYTYQRTRTQAVPHGVGFVWTTILWEVTWDLIDAHGFNTNIYDASSTAGNVVALQLVIEGMKLQPCSPGFIDARDAILAADVALYGGVHVDELWEAFARRGLGFSASQGSSNSNADNTEAFNTPEAVPPAAISDLAVVPQGDFVNLTFTATGDDGTTGTASSYDIRYSTTGPITSDALFNAATQVTGEPAPQPAGSAENVVVDGLTFTTTYHFAMKVADESANISALSNPASGVTLGPPVIVPPAVNPIVVNVPSGGSHTEPVTIGNSGASALTYGVDLAEAFSITPAPPAAAVEATEATEEAFTSDESAEKDAREVPGQPQSLGSGGPDAFGYRWIDSDEPAGPTFSWVDITATGTPVVLTDDGEANLTLPFTFEYYGVPYTALRLSSNGTVFFAAAGDMPFTNVGMPNAATPQAIIAPFWDDLNPAEDGDIYYRDMGDGRFVISWVDVHHYSGAGTVGEYTFQLILNSNGSIVTQYLEMEGALTTNTIGIENHTGTDGLQVVFDGAYVHNNLAIRFANLWVSANVTTPTVPVGGTDTFDLVFDAAGLADGTHNANMTISSNDPATPAVVIPIVFNVGAVAGEPGAPAFEGTHLLTAVRPNPFETSASFTLAVRDAGTVSVALFDALGRRVATLHDGELSAGTAHQFAVDGASLASGTYVLRVEGQGFAESRRITLLR